MHRYPDRPGIFITAVDVESGRVFWETQVADPPLTEARLSDDAQSIEAIGQSGVIYRFDVASNAISLSGIRPDRVLRFPGLTDGRIPRGCVLPSNQWIMGVPGNRELFVLQPHQDRTQVTTLPLPRQMSSLPVPFKNGVLIGLEDGSLALLDATTQQPIGQPFQCDVAPGERITWSDLLPIDADTVVAANSAGWLLKLVWTDQPTGHFEIKQSRLFDSPVVSPLCMLGDHLVIIDAKNNVLTLNLNDLATVANQELQTNVVWGPLNAGSIACFAMADGTLMLLSPDLKFTKVNINGELPVGKPVVLDNRLVIATRQGSLLALDPVQATIVRRVTFPTACATGPTVVDETLVVGTLDGRWIMVPKPDALHDATKN
jgi:outer membrane protein assembly factor BamB